jgi:hypothetical protein
VSAILGPAFEALMNEVERAKDRSSRDEADRCWRAMMLSPTPEICGALLRGESVPIDRLDQEWAARFGLIERVAA